LVTFAWCVVDFAIQWRGWSADAINRHAGSLSIKQQLHLDKEM
jgi:hypothetical protein